MLTERQPIPKVAKYTEDNSSDEDKGVNRVEVAHAMNHLLIGKQSNDNIRKLCAKFEVDEDDWFTKMGAQIGGILILWKTKEMDWLMKYHIPRPCRAVAVIIK